MIRELQVIADRAAGATNPFDRIRHSKELDGALVARLAGAFDPGRHPLGRRSYDSIRRELAIGETERINLRPFLMRAGARPVRGAVPETWQLRPETGLRRRAWTAFGYAVMAVVVVLTALEVAGVDAVGALTGTPAGTGAPPPGQLIQTK